MSPRPKPALYLIFFRDGHGRINGLAFHERPKKNIQKIFFFWIYEDGWYKSVSIIARLFQPFVAGVFDLI